MSEWMKYTFVCDPDNCDALLEFTARDGFGFPNGVVQITCPCGRQMSYISATIQPLNERNEMETNKDELVSMWRQELELTYGNQITELQNKLSSAENSREMWRNSCNNLQSQINKIIDNLTAQYFYNPNIDKEEVLRELCDILNHEPKQEIKITGTIYFEAKYDCPLEEVEDFDAQQFLQDTLTLDAYHGDVVVDTFDVQEADVDWDN